MMNNALKELQIAEQKAAQLFEEIEARGLIKAGVTEKELNQKVFDLAFELFGIRKFWHKRIVRCGKNTLLPYAENPANLTVHEDDILFFDFGPVFDEWEADFGRTYVIGNNPQKIKLANDVAEAWAEGKKYYEVNKAQLSGADFYRYTKDLAQKYGWEYGNEHCGHLIGNFPHEQIVGEEIIHYLHPENNILMSEKDKNGNERFWIYEIHFIDKKLGIGGFYEQLLS